MIRVILLSLFIAIGCVASGCGTETGNPGKTYNTAPTAGDSTTESSEESALTSERVLNQLCATLSACQPTVTTDACRTGALAASALHTRLGLAQESYVSYSAVLEAERAGSLVPDTEAEARCRAEITALSCTGAEVTASFNAASSGDFSGLSELIPQTEGNCPAVFNNN